MATLTEEPPGGKSYAALLRSNLPSVLRKNVLEIVLEKDWRGPFIISTEECVKVITKLGIDPKPGVNIESVQICPNGRGVVFITLRDEIPIEKFCSHDVIQVTQSGIRAVQFDQLGKGML